METHEGKSVPLVKGFQIAPVTPVKPYPRPIFEDGHFERESEDYLSRFSHPNQAQAQTLLSCSITSSERRIPNNHQQNNSNIWDDDHNIHGRINLQRGNEEYLHRWSPSSYPTFSCWDLPFPWKNNGVRENNYNKNKNFSDPLSQFDNMSFGDLLAINGSALEPSSVSSRIGDGNVLFPGWDYQPQELQNSAYPYQQWSYSNVNSPPKTNHANGKNSTFAPPTPDLQRRAEIAVTSGNTNLPSHQNSNEQNRLQEDEVAAAAMVNLNNKEPGGEVSMAEEENHNSDKGGNHCIDLNNTPQKKPRRKRYTPKVVNENKPKKTPKPKTPKPTDTKETPRTKRKYVRKNKTNTPPSMTSAGATETVDPKMTSVEATETVDPKMTSAGATETIDPKPTEPAVKSCRRSLNFDLNQQVPENNSLRQPNDFQTVHLRQGEELIVETSQVGFAYDLNRTLNQELKNYISLPEQTILTKEPSRTDLAQSPNSSQCASSNEGVQTRGSKRAYSSITDATNVAANHIFLHDGDIHGVPRILFPEICKKKRTDKGQRLHTSSISSSVTAFEDGSQATGAQNHPKVYPTASKYCYWNPDPYAVTNNQVEMLMRNAENRVQLLNTWLDISRLKRKKRSKGPTRVRDLAPLKGITSLSPAKTVAKCPRRRKSDNSSCTNQSNSFHSCMEAVGEDNHGNPRSKRRYRKQNSVVKSRSSKVNKQRDLVLYDGNQSIRNTTGSTRMLPLLKIFSLEAITEGLQRLDINREGCKKTSYQEQNALVPYRVNYQEQNALVPYGNDGTLVPFEGLFDPIKKRRQRAKVDLDDETTRVWRLLLENIDNEGIDGTDEEKTKWWENERSVFHGRVDSFIARMRLVQGDRRFTPWKGSVLDSVIGVFLTQNVSDHLSSSAFMSLAARFPIKSESNGSTLSEATSAFVVEPDVCVIEPEESITWNDKSVDDATSSQQSVISSQNSVNSPNLQTVGMMSTFSESNSRAQALASSSQCHYFDCSTSFMGLLKMAENTLLHDSYGQRIGHEQPECLKHVAMSDYQLYQKSDFLITATTGIEMIEVESISSDTSRKDENSITEQSNLTTESTVDGSGKKKDCTTTSSPENVSSCYVLEGENMVIQSERQSRKDSPDNIASSSAEDPTSSIWKSPNLPNSSQEAADVTESTTTVLDRANNDHKEVEQISEHNHTSGGISDIANANPTKPKKGKAGKDKRNSYDWDKLRKEAQLNGRKERTANTRDSIDWEAVKRAHVSEIADTIKERGMNNMLAERIKDLLDRLVKEHGSIDLEWLRDIPPDKAKEYLLSFRGLGLKSVECVRLLTLHHLAFPVDTNVGRIAVRLGWVPLQPLPESLQLHLLEMYPILESIQKYLWPRLCKLDQKTLYELHYHMITFGKVFCTKRQPNCNACPLRGECRHFASAFASARLSLPGPDERSIVASNGGSSIHVDPQVNINPLPLPLSWSNHHPTTNFGWNKDALIGVPSNPLSLPLPQPTQLLERKSQVSCEPIVEVPASPEPEPEQEQTICDIEDTFYEDPNEIPTIELNMKEFTQTLQNFMQANRELQESGMSRELVALTPEAASIPTPKLKNISRLRTEHHVYELPDTHPLLKGWDKREPDDPCSYLLAIWTPGETANSIQPPERRCSSDDPSILCYEETCSYCSSQREADSQIVRGTLLIPCRTAMRGSFPLNGTYFQVNEVFADHDSSLQPMAVPRSWLWNLPRRTVYFGTSIPTIFRGLTTEDIQHCFWRGFVCVRGFDQKIRAPRPLMARLHFPASKMPRGPKGKANDE